MSNPEMIPSFSLRPATEDDVATILEIENRVHVSPWAESNIRTELEKPYSQFLVLTDDETDSKIMGYVVFWLMFEEIQILNVVVDNSFRGLGFAKFMLRKAMQQAEKKGIKKATLEVRKSNQPAVQLYQSLNFVITHVRKSFYSNGEDAYHMTLNLEGEDLSF